MARTRRERSGQLLQHGPVVRRTAEGNADEAIHDLSAGESVDWLGYHLRRPAGQWAIEIGPGRLGSGWNGDRENAHLRPASPDSCTVSIVEGWVDQIGPSWPFSDREAVLQRVLEIAGRYGFDEVPSAKELEKRWSVAHDRWCRLRRYQEGQLSQRLSAIPDYVGQSSVREIIKRQSAQAGVDLRGLRGSPAVAGSGG